MSEAERTAANALAGYLPQRFPLVLYGRDRPEPPATARVLARDREGRPAVFQVGLNALGFTGHPGTKAAIVEDLIMEFEEGRQILPPASRTCVLCSAASRTRWCRS